ncbi:MAG: hypothetical protein R3F60_18415 [bacterium]
MVTLARIDADGDGLDDLVVGTAAEIFVFHQAECDAREVEDGRCERTP